MQEGVTEKTATQLAIEFPAFFTLQPAARERVGFFVGEVCVCVRVTSNFSLQRLYIKMIPQTAIRLLGDTIITGLQ